MILKVEISYTVWNIENMAIQSILSNYHTSKSLKYCISILLSSTTFHNKKVKWILISKLNILVKKGLTYIC
jgi:hypothetical protein